MSTKAKRVRDGLREVGRLGLCEGATQQECADVRNVSRQAINSLERTGVRALWRMQVSEKFRAQRGLSLEAITEYVDVVI